MPIWLGLYRGGDAKLYQAEPSGKAGLQRDQRKRIVASPQTRATKGESKLTAPGNQAGMAIVALVSVAVSFLYFQGDIIPSHDLLGRYAFFHFFYSEVLHSVELPLWISNISFGLPAITYQWMLLTPANYLVGALGVVLAVDDVLLLFKVSFLLEQLFFVFGLWLLARELFASRWTVLVVSLGGALAVSWTIQPFFNFYVFYLLPLVFFAVGRFLATTNPLWLWVAGTIEALSLIGNLIYVPPLHAFILVLAVAAIMAANPSCFWALLQRSAYLRPSFLLFVMTLGVIGWITWVAAAEVAIIAPGRDALTTDIRLETFLEYGRLTMATTAFGFLSGAMGNAPNSYYIGLLPLVLFAYGVARCRKAHFWMLAIPAIALFWISIGGNFARLAYFFPGMALYRHIGAVFGIAKVLVLVSAGVAFEAIQSKSEPTGNGLLQRARTPALIVFPALIAVDVVLSWHDNDHLILGEVIQDWAPLTGMRALLYLAAAIVAWRLSRRPRRLNRWRAPHWAALLGTVFLLDLGVYQWSVTRTVERAPEVVGRSELFRADPPAYQPVRSPAPIASLAGERRKLIERPTVHRNVLYDVDLAFLPWDSCGSPLPYRLNMLSMSIYQALAERNISPNGFSDGSALADTRLLADLGCGRPKLSLLDGSHETIEVVSFSANRLHVRVPVANSKGNRLFYADAYHPAWRVKINGVAAPIIRTAAGTKSVALDSGSNEVIFSFGRGPLAVVSAAMVGLGLALALVLTAAIGLVLTGTWSAGPTRQSGEKR